MLIAIIVMTVLSVLITLVGALAFYDTYDYHSRFMQHRAQYFERSTEALQLRMTNQHIARSARS